MASLVAVAHARHTRKIHDAVPGVVVRSSFDLPRLEGQHRLRPIEGLDLRLLVEADDDGGLGRVEVQPDDIAHLLGERRILADLERALKVRLEIVGLQDLVNGGLPQTDHTGQKTRGPVRVASRRRAHHGRHDLAHDLLGNVVAASGLGTVGESFHLPDLKPLPDTAHLRYRKRQPRCDLHSRDSVSGHQHHSGSPNVPRRSRRLRHESLKLAPLKGRDRERGGLSHASSYEATPIMVAPISRATH